MSGPEIIVDGEYTGTIYEIGDHPKLTGYRKIFAKVIEDDENGRPKIIELCDGQEIRFEAGDRQQLESIYVRSNLFDPLPSGRDDE